MRHVLCLYLLHFFVITLVLYNFLIVRLCFHLYIALQLLAISDFLLNFLSVLSSVC